MENKASVTALMSAFARAYHAQASARPVFNDFVARRLMTDAEYAQMRQYVLGGLDFFAPEKKGAFQNEEEALGWIVHAFLAPTPLARARFCEDSLKTALLTGTAQYVILGAGLDTFAFRERERMQRLRVFMVDHPLTQADAQRRLARAGLEIPGNLSFVPYDFEGGDLRAALVAAGFDEGKKTFFSWLGVSYYLTEAQAEALLSALSSFAAEGSTLLFDYADAGARTAPDVREARMQQMAAAGGEPMRLFWDEEDWVRLLQKHHFLLYESLAPEEIQERYFAGFDNGLAAFPHTRLALAVLKGTQLINTKEKLLREALRLFARKGYEAVSVSDIAGALNISKGALYKHYASKRALFDCLLARMAALDAGQAKRFDLPEGALSDARAQYAHALPESIAAFTEAQFLRWTRPGFCADFRRMLTLEQYQSAETRALYRQYLSGGPLEYVADFFRAAGRTDEDARALALRFYAPVFLLYSLRDGGMEEAAALTLLRGHTRRFFSENALSANKKEEAL